MSYYASNMAYNRAYEQKDGMANGAIIGGLAGAAAMGATQMWGTKVGDHLLEKGKKLRHEQEQKHNKIMSNPKSTAAEKRASLEAFNKENKTAARGNKINEMHRKNLGAGGNWKTRGIAYAGSALLGMGAGMGADAMMS